MPAISKEQFLSLARGVLIQNLGATSSQVFTRIDSTALLATGVDTITSGSIGAATTTIPLSNTSNMRIGDSVERLSGSVTMSNVRTITAIVPNTSITVSGANLGGTFPNTITIAVGGINLSNGAVPGLGDPDRAAYRIATSSDVISSVSVIANGGDLNKNGSLSDLEKDYHTTGQALFKLLK
jgi:hypothetical protein